MKAESEELLIRCSEVLLQMQKGIELILKTQLEGKETQIKTIQLLKEQFELLHPNKKQKRWWL